MTDTQATTDDTVEIVVSIPASAHDDALTAFGVKNDVELAERFAVVVAQQVTNLRKARAAQAAADEVEKASAALFGVNEEQLRPQAPGGPGGPRGRLG